MEIILLVKSGGTSPEACVFSAYSVGKVQVRMARTGWSAVRISWICCDLDMRVSHQPKEFDITSSSRALI